MESGTEVYAMGTVLQDGAQGALATQGTVSAETYVETATDVNEYATGSDAVDKHVIGVIVDNEYVTN